MAFDFFILASDKKRISNRFNLAYFVDEISYTPDFRITTGSECYVIKNYQTKEILQFKFGLESHYSSQRLCFVRAEGTRNMEDNPNYTGSKAIFLDADYNKLIRFQRCLVLADAFVVGSELQKPHVVYLRGKNRPFAFAGIYSTWKLQQEEKEINSFAVLTTVANQLLQKLGQKRMPVILFPEYEYTWLKNSSQLCEILSMLVPFPANMMNAYPIAHNIAISDTNDRTIIEPVGKPIYDETLIYRMVPRSKKRDGKDPKDHLTLGERARLSRESE